MENHTIFPSSSIESGRMYSNLYNREKSIPIISLQGINPLLSHKKPACLLWDSQFTYDCISDGYRVPGICRKMKKSLVQLALNPFLHGTSKTHKKLIHHYIHKIWIGAKIDPSSWILFKRDNGLAQWHILSHRPTRPFTWMQGVGWGKEIVLRAKSFDLVHFDDIRSRTCRSTGKKVCKLSNIYNHEWLY